jgi:hypothetical protein
VATPSGWTALTSSPFRSGTASGGTIYVFARIADGTGSDTPSPVWSGLTTGTSGDASGAGILAWSGIENDNFIQDVTAAKSDLSAQTTTSTIPALTTNYANSLVVGIAMKLLESSGQTSTVSGRTERADNSTTSGTGHIVEVCDVIKSPAGATSATTVTWSATTSARALTVSLAFAAVAPVDTGLSFSDLLILINNITVSDTGVTISDSIADMELYNRANSDTGITISDSIDSTYTPGYTPQFYNLTASDSGLVPHIVFGPLG